MNKLELHAHIVNASYLSAHSKRRRLRNIRKNRKYSQEEAEWICAEINYAPKKTKRWFEAVASLMWLEEREFRDLLKLKEERVAPLTKGDEEQGDQGAAIILTPEKNDGTKPLIFWL